LIARDGRYSHWDLTEQSGVASACNNYDVVALQRDRIFFFVGLRGGCERSDTHCRDDCGFSYHNDYFYINDTKIIKKFKIIKTELEITNGSFFKKIITE
jgi:hypothetical protein